MTGKSAADVGGAATDSEAVGAVENTMTGESDAGEEVAPDAAADTDAIDSRQRGASAHGVLELITRSLTDAPDDVVIEVEERGDAVRFRVRAARGDMGRLIGRRGRVAQAIRTIVRVAGAQDEVETHVDFVDD